MQLLPIDSISGINKKDFTEQYVKTGTPVIIKDFLKDSPALQLWNYDYFKEQAGDLIVSVHGHENAHPDKVVSQAAKKMKFSEYLDYVQAGPTEARLFLFNLLTERPEFKEQLVINRVTNNILSSLPFMFFGGEGSSTRYHFDIDISHVFLSQFEGAKKVWLFPPEQSDFLYKLPYNFHGIADLRNPDYEKFPALKYLHGWECTLHFGDTLFMPAHYWHYIQYETQGYSVSHRALSDSYIQRLQGARNLFITRRFDNLMRIWRKDKWFNYKKQVAINRAEKAIKKLEH